MNDTFIELHRRFEEYGTDDTPESQAQRSYTAAFLGQEQGFSWDELLGHRLVVILGEPGSGKTRELKARHHRLHQASFFLPLDRLVSEDVDAILDDKEKQDPLTPEKARLGVESLAAAVVLCRQLRIRVTVEAALTDDNLLSPATVLPSSWLPNERRAMTDRALFDGVSHGAISFHHRYHIEYLAAAWVERLMANNCGLEAFQLSLEPTDGTVPGS